MLRAHEPVRELFGHPKGLTFLFATEMWERFSYYGMRALLMLYMVNSVLLPGQAERVWGYGGLKMALEALAGPLDPQPLASYIYGLYTGFVYLTPILGGLLADRVLGQRRTVIIGAILMALGHFMMAFEPLLFLALLTLILGNGAFKPNISTQVGGLYGEQDARRDRAYSIFYMGINLGALAGGVICGGLGELIGWHYGFGAAGVGMLLGLAIYLYARNTLPADEPASVSRTAPAPLSAGQWQAIGALALLFLPVTLFWAGYEQQGNTIALWASGYTDRSINLYFWQLEIPVTWFQSFNPFMILAFTPFVVALWSYQARRGREPSAAMKMALGCLGLALGNLILAYAASTIADGGKASWLWLTGYFVIVTIGELYLSPVGLSLVSKTAPLRLISMIMGIWLATSFIGNLMAGWLGGYWGSMGKAEFFLMIAGVAASAAAGITLLKRLLTRMLGTTQSATGVNCR